MEMNFSAVLGSCWKASSLNTGAVAPASVSVMLVVVLAAPVLYWTTNMGATVGLPLA